MTESHVSFPQKFSILAKKNLSAMAILSYCYDCSFRQLQELEIQKSLKPGPFRMSILLLFCKQCVFAIFIAEKEGSTTDNSLPGCLGIIVTCTCTVLLYFCCNKRQIWLFFKEIVSL